MSDLVLSRDAILSAEDRPAKTVPVPEWGGSVRLRAMSSDQARIYGESIRDASGMVQRERIAEKLLAVAIVDEAGQPMFSEADVAALAGKNSNVIQRLFVEADKLNQITEAKVEEAEKN